MPSRQRVVHTQKQKPEEYVPEPLYLICSSYTPKKLLKISPEKPLLQSKSTPESLNFTTQLAEYR